MISTCLILAARRLRVSDGRVRAFVGARGGVAERGGAGLRCAAAVRASTRSAERARRAAAGQCGASRSRAARRARRDRRAFLTNAVANRASRVQGRAFCHDLRARLAVAGDRGLTRGPAGRRSRRRRSWAPCWPRSACRSTTAQRLCLYGTARGVLAAAVRLGIAGSYEAQRLQDDMRAAMLAVAERCARSTSAIWRRRRRCSTCCRRRTIGSIRACFSPEGGSPCLVRASTIIRTITTRPGVPPSGAGAFPERDTPLAATIARAPSPSASAARSAAARRRCCSRSAARCATRTPRGRHQRHLHEGGCRVPGAQPGAARRSGSPRSRPAAVRTRRCATTSARTSRRWTG